MATVNLICRKCGKGFTRQFSNRRRKFCSRKCCSDSKRIDPAGRFWKYVEKGDGCWNWRGGIEYWGYGIFSVNRKSFRAHRWSWEQANGPIPKGMLVCHKCDNPRCVRPDHLFLGTNSDNTTDMVRKGRSCRGAASPNAKLSDADVIEIKARIVCRENRATIALKYHVSKALINAICYGRSWKHIPFIHERKAI